MKKLIIPFILFLFLFACEKNKPEVAGQDEEKIEQPEVENFVYSNTIPGGCAIKDSTNLKDYEIGPDTVYYTINEGELNIFVGFTSNCCVHFTPESYIRNDSIFINLYADGGPFCNCVCYFTYNFLYSGIVYPHVYSVNIADYLFFTGTVEP